MRANNKWLFLSLPHMGGEEFPNNYMAPLGSTVDAFEKEFHTHIGIPHCLALAVPTRVRCAA